MASQRSTRKPPEARQSPPPARRWSQRVMQTSHALDLEPGVFTLADPRQIALSLKRSALASQRRKSEPYASAMSMLTFHMNRAGQQLTAERRRTLNAAKAELRKVFGRAVPGQPLTSRQRPAAPGISPRRRAAAAGGLRGRRDSLPRSPDRPR